MEENVIRTYSLNFKGYWREENKGAVPAESGIYMVYRCIYNNETDTVRLIDIIYIGQSCQEGGVRGRLATHEKQEDFNAQLHEGEELCYAFAPVNADDLDVVENALVFAQKPILNDELKNHFNHSAVAIKVDGRCNLLRYTNYQIS